MIKVRIPAGTRVYFMMPKDRETPEWVTTSDGINHKTISELIIDVYQSDDLVDGEEFWFQDQRGISFNNHLVLHIKRTKVDLVKVHELPVVETNWYVMIGSKI